MGWTPDYDGRVLKKKSPANLRLGKKEVFGGCWPVAVQRGRLGLMSG